jgi:[ribosomal protein S18]-alanine N-acetyltransferase
MPPFVENLALSEFPKLSEDQQTQDIMFERNLDKYLEQVIALDEILFSPIHWGEEGMMRAIDPKYSSYRYYYTIKSKENPEIIAYGGFEIHSKDIEYCDITCVAVNPKYQGKKVGEFLLLNLIAESIKKGCKYMMLSVKVDNFIAKRLYEKIGFKTVEFIRNYYGDSKNEENDCYRMFLNAKTFLIFPQLQNATKEMYKRFNKISN